MNPPVVRIEKVSTDAFRCDSMHLAAGELGIVCVGGAEAGRVFADTLLGLSPLHTGTVELLGMPVYQWPVSRRLRWLSQVSHVNDGLISNLKVWENLVLPSAFHQSVPPDEAEARLLEALDQLQNKEDWVSHRLHALPDTLSTYEARMAGLLRCAVQRPRLIVAEFLFDDLEEGPLENLLQMLGWLRKTNAALAVLLVHLGPIPAGHSTLHDLQASWMIQLESTAP